MYTKSNLTSPFRSGMFGGDAFTVSNGGDEQIVRVCGLCCFCYISGDVSWYWHILCLKRGATENDRRVLDGKQRSANTAGISVNSGVLPLGDHHPRHSGRDVYQWNGVLPIRVWNGLWYRPGNRVIHPLVLPTWLHKFFWGLRLNRFPLFRRRLHGIHSCVVCISFLQRKHVV